MEREIKFFLGSNTKRGFVPLFDELKDPVGGYRMLILKGGPGSGKSTLMRRIAKSLAEQGHSVEYIHCASDPNSLDAVLDYTSRAFVVDGTAPHIIDPTYPGVCDMIINLGDLWDEDILMQNKDTIIKLSDIIKNCHKMATACITSAAILLDYNKTLAGNYINLHTVNETLRQWKDELSSSASGSEKKRLLSAVSIGETVFFDDTLTALCPKLYGIPDEWGAVSQLLLSDLRDFASENHLDFITCYCSIRTPEKIDHLLFPSAGLGFTTLNSFHATASKACSPVSGLMDQVHPVPAAAMEQNLSIAGQLIGTAAGHVAKAKELHDELEAFYVKAMDFSKMDQVYDRITEKILLYRLRFDR